MAEIPRRLVESTQSKFPTEWNKMVGNFEELSSNGTFNLPSPTPQARELRVMLTAGLYRGVSSETVAANPVRWDGDDWAVEDGAPDIDVYPDESMPGYCFTGQLIKIGRCSANGRYYSLCDGFTALRARLSSALSAGGTANAAFPNLAIGDSDPSAPVTDKILSTGESIPSGQEIDVVFDPSLKKWKLAGAQCQQVTGGD